jgi:N-acetylmuramic acid 6-phosphate etherase
MPTTESVNPRFVDIDLWSTSEAVDAMLEGQLSAIAAIKSQTGKIAIASEAAANHLMKGGRLIYVGAGTSGRIAVQDGVELGPTFGWPATRLAYVIAGGIAAFAESVENAEDDAEDSCAQLTGLQISANDVVIGVAASGGTPFTVSAIEMARHIGALTIGVANNGGTPLLNAADHALLADTGSEPIAGSTRMKAGTAQKAILNIVSTAIMLRFGRVYRGLMVNMVISNEKLLRRAHGMVSTLGNCGPDAAAAAVEAAQGNIKVAVLIAQGLSVVEATTMLAKHNDNLRTAVDSVKRDGGK